MVDTDGTVLRNTTEPPVVIAAAYKWGPEVVNAAFSGTIDRESGIADVSWVAYQTGRTNYFKGTCRPATTKF